MAWEQRKIVFERKITKDENLKHNRKTPQLLTLIVTGLLLFILSVMRNKEFRDDISTTNQGEPAKTHFDLCEVKRTGEVCQRYFKKMIKTRFFLSYTTLHWLLCTLNWSHNSGGIKNRIPTENWFRSEKHCIFRSWNSMIFSIEKWAHVGCWKRFVFIAVLKNKQIWAIKLRKQLEKILLGMETQNSLKNSYSGRWIKRPRWLLLKWGRQRKK